MSSYSHIFLKTDLQLISVALMLLVTENANKLSFHAVSGSYQISTPLRSLINLTNTSRKSVLASSSIIYYKLFLLLLNCMMRKCKRKALETLHCCQPFKQAVSGTTRCRLIKMNERGEIKDPRLISFLSFPFWKLKTVISASSDEKKSSQRLQRGGIVDVNILRKVLNKQRKYVVRWVFGSLELKIRARFTTAFFKS